MKKIVTVIIITAFMLLTLASCETVDVSGADKVKINYDYEGTLVSAEIDANNAVVIVNNVHGCEIKKDEPKDAKFVDGVYFEISGTRFYIDLNGGESLKVDDKGYIHVEKYKLEAMMSVFQTYGVNPYLNSLA